MALTLFCSVSHADTLAESALINTDHLRSQMLSSVESVVPGQPFWVALRLQHEPQWHTYWRVPGDSGLPTEIKWQLPAGWQASEIHWPQPQRIPYGDLVNYGLQDDAVLLVQITPPPVVRDAEIKLNAQAHWLICHDVCIPGQGEYQLMLQAAAAGAPAKPSIWQTRLQRAQTALPKNLAGWQIEAAWTAQGVALHLRAKPQKNNEPQKLPQSLTYFPYQAERIANGVPQKFSVAQNRATLVIPANPANKTTWPRLEGLLVADDGAWSANIEIPIQGVRPAQLPRVSAVDIAKPVDMIGIVPAAPVGSLSTLFGAFVGAFIGGLILNLMPCVFPVLSIKILAAIQHERQHPGTLHRHGVFYTLGVLSGFGTLALLLLTLRAAGSELGWGFHLQNAWVVLALAALFTLIALNLLGWFEIRWGQTRAAEAEQALQQQAQLHPHGSAVLTGLLAVVVASPCSAPFMGAALGFALTQPAAVALLVFVALGLGLATPYLLLCFSPGLLKYFPKSGRWMQRAKQWLALPMLLTVIWLLWVYGRQTSTFQQSLALSGLCVMALLAWGWGCRQLGAKNITPVKWVLLGLVCVWAIYGGLLQQSMGTVSTDQNLETAWQPYSELAVQTALAQNKTVLVDFTAAWCITCQVNKRLVLETAAIKRALADSGVVLLRADWTRQDAHITAALQRLGRNGVPVYWLQRPGQPAVLLPEILTSEVVLAALK